MLTKKVGTETTYTYDKQHERLQNAKLMIAGQTVMDNKYQYDAVDNILGITNAANPQGLTKLNKAKLGGASTHTYQYDELNRLIHATGKAKNASYDMTMTFGLMSEPLTKVQKIDSSLTAKSYNFAYKYEDESHPTAPTQIGHDHYTYDANGNPTLVVNDSTNATREMFWDEDNRLMVLSDNGKTSRYTYNAGGERIMKSYGTMEGVYINGAPQGITFHETDNFTLYPAPIISINKNRFTKHYFIGSQRIASRIGTGTFNNVYGVNGSYVTAGQQDYAERMNQIQSQKEAYYKELGIAPGVPTEKGAYGDPENTGVGYNTIITNLGDHSVPEGWVQTPKHNTTEGSTPGTPISWNEPSTPDDPQAGYGYISNDTTMEETFFFHSDHLGSTSYITDDKGNITQYDAYLPYGELLVDEHSSSEEMPYKFNGKEFDEETGLYYYGARYMDPVASMWYGVDKLFEKFLSVSAYTYCKNSPLNYKDVRGLFPKGIVSIHYEIRELATSSSITGAITTTRQRKAYYRFTESAAHLLSLVSGVSETYIRNVKLEEFAGQPKNNSITIGTDPMKVRMLVSPTYFDESGSTQNEYYDWWMREFSHEVGHIKQIGRDKSLTLYVVKTIFGYVSTLSHDKSPREIEAEKGSENYEDFRDYVKTNLKSNIINLLRSNKSEKEKIQQIDKWWSEYQQKKK